MPRPTVNDIAREAGVSLATVDRVLNGRSGVRQRTIDAVHGAIERLGYVRDMAAANLARNRSHRMAILLPDTESQFVQTLVDAMAEAARAQIGARVTAEILRFPAEDMHRLAAMLQRLGAEGVSGVGLVAPETPVLRDAVRALRGRGVPVVALVSDLPNCEVDHFVGINSRAAGRTAGLLVGRFLGDRPPRVMVIANSMLQRDSLDRRSGFDEIMQARFPAVEVLQTIETHGQGAILHEVVGRMVAGSGPVGAIYLAGTGHRALATTLADLDLLGRVVVVGHDLTPQTRAALQAGWLDAVIAQNVGHVARSTLRVLRAKADDLPLDRDQERLRIEIILRENLPEA